jgi:hypothetical protein
MTLMDTAQLLGNLGDFVGAIVVTATLIYLAVQVRQNTKALQAQSRQAALSSAQAELFAIVEHPDIMLAQTGVGASPLSPEGNVKLAFWLLAVMRSRQFSWLQYQDGIIDDVQWSAEALIIVNVLGSSVNRAWWTLVGRNLFPAEFAAFVDDLIRDRPIIDETAERFVSWSKWLSQS